MPSVNERQRNNVRAGIFVTASIAVGLGVVVILTDAIATFTHKTSEYTVVFTVSSGVSNLTSGSPVLVGGLDMGQVIDVRPMDQDPLEEIEVRFELDRDVELYDNARIVVSSPLIGTEGWLDITTVGSGDPAVGPIPGTPAPGVLSSVLGSDADTVIANTVRFSEFLAEMPDRFDEYMEPPLTDVKELMQDLNHNRWPQWADRVDLVADGAVEITGDVGRTVDNADGFVNDARAVIGENREQVASIVDNVDQGSADFRSAARVISEETVAKMNAILDRGREGVDSAVAALQALEQDYSTWAADASVVMGNAALMSQKLKLTANELDRNPWKLLYRPQIDELENEMLYEAARSFAVAATDLKDASGSVQRLLETYQGRLDEGTVGRLERNLVASLENYERAQEQLFEAIVDLEKP